MKTLLTTLILALSIFVSFEASTKVDKKMAYAHKGVKAINRMIKIIKPRLDAKKSMKLAQYIFNNSKKYKIDPKVMIAIIDTESDFDNTKISHTGDISLAQINTDIWNKELKRMKLPLIDSKRLKKDEKYALGKMAMILSILKERHAEKDGNWFARYHSRTQKHKTVYYAKVESRMRKIASIRI